jgi:colanic acid/amylovoran biosynthesis glycosyltransferase
MKIAYILGVFPCLSETFILREMLALQRQGLSVAVFALQRPSTAAGPQGAAGPWATHTVYASDWRSWRGARTWLTFPLRHPLRLLRYLALMLSRTPRDPVGAWRWLRAGPPAVYWAERARRAGVTHVHAAFATAPAEVGLVVALLLAVPFSFAGHARDIFLPSNRALAWKLRRAAFATVCTRPGYRRLRDLTPAAEHAKILLAHHGLLPPDLAVGPRRPEFVLAVGRLVPKKGFHILLQACRQLLDDGRAVRVRVVGDGPLRAALEQTAARLGVAHLVEFGGARSPAELRDDYARARLLAQPSVVAPDGDRDGLPNVLLEAMAWSLPVIATTACAADEAVTDGRQGFLIAPGDSRALAERIGRLLADPDLAARMGRAGRTTVLTRFDAVKNTETLVRRFRHRKGS